MSGALVQRYRSLPRSRDGRLELARHLARDPSPMIEELLAAAREPRPDRLHSAPAPLVRELSEVTDGRRAPTGADFAFWLAREGRLAVAGEPLLDCSYVDRELSLGVRGPGRLRLDLLMANAYDRVPVLAEVKLGADKDPFAAVVQLLACVSLVVGHEGVRRLSGAYPEARLATGVVDGMVLLVEPRWRARGWLELLDAARDVARAVSAGAAGLVRRITFLTVSRRLGGLWRDAERI